MSRNLSPNIFVWIALWKLSCGSPNVPIWRDRSKSFFFREDEAEQDKNDGDE
jgi:hypothetical protein